MAEPGAKMAVLTTGSAGSHLGERAFSPCLGGLAIRRSGMERSRRRRALVEWSVAVGKVASQAARSAELCHESRAEWRCEAGCGAARVTKGGSLGRAR